MMTDDSSIVQGGKVQVAARQSGVKSDTARRVAGSVLSETAAIISVVMCTIHHPSVNNWAYCAAMHLVFFTLKDFDWLTLGTLLRRFYFLVKT